MSTNFRAQLVNHLSLALLAVLVNHLLHESSHALAAGLVGARVTLFNFFAVDHAWPGAASAVGDLLIASNAALVNIAVMFWCVALFATAWAKQRPAVRLFIMYLGAYSLLTGFGYLMIDPLFYQPGDMLGDWKQVVGYFGGGWGVRLPIALIGAAGVLACFFWLPSAALTFCPDTRNRAERTRLMLTLLLLPYFVISTLYLILSFWHPVGPQGVFIIISQYWIGHSPFVWSFFIAAYWKKVREPRRDVMPLSPEPRWTWLMATVAAYALAVGVLLPSLRF